MTNLDFLEAIAAERKNQLAKGYDAAHDDQHKEGEIARLAAAYAARAGLAWPEAELLHPWPEGFREQTSQVDDLITAGALIVAELERIARECMGGSA